MLIDWIWKMNGKFSFVTEIEFIASTVGIRSRDIFAVLHRVMITPIKKQFYEFCSFSANQRKDLFSDWLFQIFPENLIK